MLSPKAAIVSVFRNYATFSGRATRSEYWWFQLFQVVVFLLVVFGALIPVSLSDTPPGETPPAMGLVGTVLFLLGLAVIIPNLSVFVRRLHDSDLSGWFYFLTVIPGFGAIITVVFALLPSNPAGARFDAVENFGSDTPAWKSSQKLG
jgi:uncharacterized membrane protein YhaH (DUF805 family)